MRTAVLTVLLFTIFTGTATSQTTSFSYQGSITESGTPGNGPFQMEFKLFDALTGGTQIGSTITNSDVTAVNGVFRILLDFGASPFSGSDRFLEIAVRRNAKQSYTVLSPRQQIASSPFAIRTLSAEQADAALDSEKLGGVNASEYVTNSSLTTNAIRNQTILQSSANFNISGDGYFGGRIGIGTTSPAGPLHLQTTTTFAPLYLTSAAGFPAQSSWRLQPDAGIAGQGAAFGVFSNTAQAYRLFINGSGNVGIGSTAPTSRLDVVGQDGLQITGFQPFLTFRDSNNANKGGRIQSADGKLIFRPDALATLIPSVVMEANGNVGIGPVAANARLSLVGGPLWTSNAWTAAMNMANGHALGWMANPSGQRFGIGQSGGGLYFFRTNSDFGNMANPATYDMVINDAGNILQARDKAGLVKAMLVIDQNRSIVRCYNGMTGSTTPPCGFTINSSVFGTTDLDLNFNISDRFLSVSFESSIGEIGQFYQNQTSRIFVSTRRSDGTPIQLKFNVIVF